MKFDQKKLSFRQLSENVELPYELLLLADPSKEAIDKYLINSFVFIVEQNKKLVGTIVLQKLAKHLIEIKNIAVFPDWQGKGIGHFLIENAVNFSKNSGIKTISIGTANSSLGQLYLYQKLGFEITEIKKDFFTNNYTEPIFENGIQAKHMIMLAKIIVTPPVVIFSKNVMQY